VSATVFVRRFLSASAIDGCNREHSLMVLIAPGNPVIAQYYKSVRQHEKSFCIYLFVQLRVPCGIKTPVPVSSSAARCALCGSAAVHTLVVAHGRALESSSV
jgi:hypothetical protein